MKVLTFILFAAVLISVALAMDEEKKKVWYHAPMFKGPWKQAKTCFREFRLANCFDDLRNKFGDGVKLFVDRFISTGADSAEAAVAAP